MWQQQMITTQRGQFEYFVKGEGEPLAITHFYSAFNEIGNWFAEPFTTHYQVFLINVRGAGNSASIDNDEQMALTEVIKDLEAVRQALGFTSCGFAGHSTGGMLALQYAIEAPDALTKCICGSSAASKAYASHPASIYCPENPHFTRIIEIMEALNDPQTTREERVSLSFEWTLLSFTTRDNVERALKIPNSGRTVGRALDYFRKVAVKTFDLRAQLPQTIVPTYVFCGRQDAQCPVEFSYEIAELLPNASLTIFEESNHFPFMEEQEAFAHFVEATLRAPQL